MLVIRAASGDDRALAEIVRRHTSRLRAVATRILRSSSDVDDVVQETFIAAWTHMDTVIDGDTILGWLLTTLRRRCYDRLTSASSRKQTTFPQDLPGVAQDRPDAVLQRSSLVSEASAVLERMPTLQRRCWELRQLHQRSYQQISAELEVTTSVVRGQLARARLLMETRLAHWR